MLLSKVISKRRQIADETIGLIYLTQKAGVLVHDRWQGLTSSDCCCNKDDTTPECQQQGNGLQLPQTHLYIILSDFLVLVLITYCQKSFPV